LGGQGFDHAEADAAGGAGDYGGFVGEHLFTFLQNWQRYYRYTQCNDNMILTTLAVTASSKISS
jgi:hypothetical protein